MNGVMAVGTHLIRAKTAVESRYRAMTAITKLPLALEGKQVPVGRAVGLMAGGTALYKHGTVLEDVGAAFVGVAFGTLFLLEPAKRHACLRLMGIVAGGAVQYPLLQPVPFIELELGENVTMTLPARGCGRLTLERAPVIGDRLLQRHHPGALPAQDVVATRASHA
jgi:hypothetical protein